MQLEDLKKLQQQIQSQQSQSQEIKAPPKSTEVKKTVRRKLVAKRRSPRNSEKIAAHE
jgi:hypothetical protein